MRVSYYTLKIISKKGLRFKNLKKNNPEIAPDAKKNPIRTGGSPMKKNDLKINIKERDK